MAGSGRAHRVLLGLLYASWLGGFLIVILRALRLPYDPRATGAHLHFQNPPGAVALVILVSIAEITALTLLLGAWRVDMVRRRATRTLAVFTAWVLLWPGLAVGGGPMFGEHALHLFVLWCILAALAIASWLPAGRRTPPGAARPGARSG